VGFVSDRVFDRNVSALSETLLEAADTFAEQRSIAPLDRSGLRQLTTPIDDVASELLRFGHDVWPPSATEEFEPHTVLADQPARLIPKLRRSGVMPAFMAATVVGAGTIGASLAHNVLDHDHDGVISLADLHATLDQIGTGSTMHVQRKVVIRGVEKNATISWTIPGGYEVEDVEPVTPALAKLEKGDVEQVKEQSPDP
jgi:hypothetical protein